MRFDLAIVGAGVVGASAAFHFADRGLRVALIDDGTPGASHAAAGMLSPTFEIGHDAAGPAFAQMMRESLESWDAFAHRLADDPYAAFGYHRRGVYGIGYHALPVGAVRPERDALSSFTRRASSFVPNEGSLEPRRFIEVLKARAAASDATLIKGTASFNGDVLCVDGEKIFANRVLLASGARPETARDGMQAVQGRAFLVRLSADDKGVVPTVVRSPNVYFCPRGERDLYIGATEEWPGAFAASVEDVWQDACRLLPALHRAEVVERLAGRRPFLRRGGPVIERHGECSGVIIAQGHHRNGVLLTPLTVQRIEDIMG